MTQNVVRLPDRNRPDELGRIVNADALDALLARARRLAATPGLDPEHRALARAGRIVLGLEREVEA